MSSLSSLVADDIVVHSVRGRWAPDSDDRSFVDPGRRVFVVANGDGPKYGGYHAPFALDPGLRAFVAALASCDWASPIPLLQPFTAAQTEMRRLAREYEHALDGRRGLDAARRATEAVCPAAWRRLAPYCHFGGAITAVCLRGRSVLVGQVGDCRAYAAHDGVPSLLLPDHSLPSVIAATAGTSSPSYLHALAYHRVVTTRWLGLVDEVAVDYAEAAVAPGEHVLLCTPGVWNDDGGDAAVRQLISCSSAKFAGHLCEIASERRTDCTALRFSVAPPD